MYMYTHSNRFEANGLHPRSPGVTVKTRLLVPPPWKMKACRRHGTKCHSQRNYTARILVLIRLATIAMTAAVVNVPVTIEKAQQRTDRTSNLESKIRAYLNGSGIPGYSNSSSSRNEKIHMPRAHHAYRQSEKRSKAVKKLLLWRLPIRPWISMRSAGSGWKGMDSFLLPAADWRSRNRRVSLHPQQLAKAPEKGLTWFQQGQARQFPSYCLPVQAWVSNRRSTCR